LGGALRCLADSEAPPLEKKRKKIILSGATMKKEQETSQRWQLLTKRNQEAQQHKSAKAHTHKP
jgi:hypothetical protein